MGHAARSRRFEIRVSVAKGCGSVVSFDSHLKLRADFSLDRTATREALDAAWKPGPEPRLDRRRQPEPSLARHLDRSAASRAASPERALEVVARALEALPGEKLVVYLGFGFGHYSSTGVTMTAEYDDAVRAWGPPARSGKLSDGAEVHTWVSESGPVYRSGPSVGFGIGSFGGRGSIGVGASVPVGQGTVEAPARCERTFTFRDGRMVEQSWIGQDSVCAEYARPKP